MSDWLELELSERLAPVEAPEELWQRVAGGGTRAQPAASVCGSYRRRGYADSGRSHLVPGARPAAVRHIAAIPGLRPRRSLPALPHHTLTVCGKPSRKKRPARAWPPDSGILRLRIGMLRAQLIVFAAGALLMVQVQCAAACAAELCGNGCGRSESVPPCHRHQHRAPSQNRTPDGCPQRTILAPAISLQTPQAEFQPLSVTGQAAAMEPARPADMGSSELALSSFAPPGGKSLSVIVLRI